MNITKHLTGTVLAAALITGLTATGASAHPQPDTPVRSAAARPHGSAKPVPPKRTEAAAPILPSAPLDGLPTLREAGKRGLLAKSGTSGNTVGPRSFPAPGCDTPPQGSGYHDYLNPGECLREGTYIAVHSDIGYWYELWVYEGDLVLYGHDALTGYQVLWQTDTRSWNASLWMQRDGNVVLYDGQGNPRWNLGTQGCGGQGAWLRVQADTNVVLYTRDWKPIWARFDGPAGRPC
ncbi:hypothetical protein ACFVQ4_28375 [Streptomyces laurentii]|uniref:hypothetical protein n=1 Tax=Streptomyces laurentii TaxID=39478 RepID=UPI003699B648